MLDDLKYAHQRDSHDSLGIAERQWQQLEHNFDTLELKGDFENVVYAGMGGSALSAFVARSWPGYVVPFEICRQYHIPHYVSEKTLFIAASYSGNTEETIAALAEAESAKAKMVIISSGGKLQEIATAKGYPWMMIPPVDQPRYSTLYILRAIAHILSGAGLADFDELNNQMQEAASYIKGCVSDWLVTVSTENNRAKQLAYELAGKSPVVYGGPLMAPIAYKWKISFNENAKNIAWWDEVPEFDHNELIGWSSHPIDKPYAPVDLRSNLENPRVLKRFEVAERILSGMRPAPYVIEVQGRTVLEQLVWAMALGDFVSIYLALLNGVNPAPVDLVEKFKTELNK